MIGVTLRGVTLVPLLYGFAGVISALFYMFDKSAARRGDWRVSERTLHIIDFCCGIIGGLLAQEVVRHKTSKPSFRRVTWAIAALHAFALAAIIVIGIAPVTWPGAYGPPQIIVLP